MEILQLRYFCRAAEIENFSETAAQFGVPPSNISQCIKRLERELGTTLFSRSANRLRLNSSGRSFYEKISPALALIDSAKAEAAYGEKSGQIKISIRTNRRIVMQTIEKFRREYPEVSIIAKHNPLDKNDDFDLIVSAENMQESGYRSVEILNEGLLLAVKRGSVLDKETPITEDELRTETFISMNAGTSMHELTLRVGEKLGFKPRIALQSDDPFYVRRCAELGLGCVVIPSVSWRGQFSDDVVFRPFFGMHRKTYVSWKKCSHLPESTEYFIKLLAEECKSESAQ